MTNKLSTEEAIVLLQTKQPKTIRIFNFGENIGADFLFFDLFWCIHGYYPHIRLELIRSNVDDCNCIGFDQHQGRVQLPVHQVRMCSVKQRYPDGSDWAQRFSRGDYSIFDQEIFDLTKVDYVSGIAMGSAPAFLESLGLPVLDIGTLVEAVRQLQPKTIKKEIVPHSFYQNRGAPLRGRMEYVCHPETDYPFGFVEPVRWNAYTDYLRISLRWPDNTRWYYPIEDQYDMLFAVLRKIREAGRPVKVLYTLKDGEVGNNFNRGQAYKYLKAVQDLSDDCIFTYSWTTNPHPHRSTEEQELALLKVAGIRKVMKVDIWDDLHLASKCKVVLCEPAGFAETLCKIRKNPASMFLLPTSVNHLYEFYSVFGSEGDYQYLKVNKNAFDVCYECNPTMSSPDTPGGQRVLSWEVAGAGLAKSVPCDDNVRDDQIHLRNEHLPGGIFRDMCDRTKYILVDEIVRQYCL